MGVSLLAIYLQSVAGVMSVVQDLLQLIRHGPLSVVYNRLCSHWHCGLTWQWRGCSVRFLFALAIYEMRLPSR